MPPERPSTGARRARDRRVLGIGLGASLGVHILLLVLASRWLEPIEPGARYVASRPAPAAPEGMRIIDLAAVPDTDPLDDVAPRPPDLPTARQAPVPPVAGADEEVAPPSGRTAAERLSPRVVDPRLWRPMILLPREPTLEDVQARIAAATEMLSDSALAEAERALRLRDWTAEDAEGGRWGISPGQLHLGKITLPLPLFFPVDPDELVRQTYWFELETQLERAQVLESFDTRVRAIRERRERERNEQREAGDNGGM